MKEEKIDYVLTELTREARNHLKLLWVVKAPEKQMRDFLTELIKEIKIK